MSPDNQKDTAEILELIRVAQSGNSRAEGFLVNIYQPYVDFMVRKYSKKTDIKDDDDLRSCINIGLLEGIRRFDPGRNTKFIYFAHIWMKKNIFLEESIYRFIRVPVNQKVFYDTCTKELYEAEKKDADILDKDIQKFLALENTKTEYFSDLLVFDEDSGVDELPEHLLASSYSQTALEEEIISIDILRANIKKVLMGFNTKEVFIIEHLYGVNGAEPMSSEQIAEVLGVTKVNITFTKTRVIRMLRHSSLSNQLINGI